MDCDQSKLKDIVKSALDELLETELAPLHASMNFINKEFEDMKKKISALEERNSDLVKENNFQARELSYITLKFVFLMILNLRFDYLDLSSSQLKIRKGILI